MRLQAGDNVKALNGRRAAEWPTVPSVRKIFGGRREPPKVRIRKNLKQLILGDNFNANRIT